MTLHEKVAQLTQDVPSNKRLSIPAMLHNNCLHGLSMQGAKVNHSQLHWGPLGIFDFKSNTCDDDSENYTALGF